MKSSFNDPIARSGLESIHDAVHGPIDIRDAADCGSENVLARLLSTPMLNRLRRIEQLGFSSQQYIAADHSRYAHALGTMHMMRSMLRVIIDRGGPPLNQLQELKKNFPSAFSGKTNHSKMTGRLAQHMLVAALVQDIGELPYNMASTHVYMPSDQIREKVAEWVGIRNVGGWTGKEIFTVACLHELWETDPPANLDKLLLVYLLTGASSTVPPGKFKAFRHMLDGVVDADRLDYVFRDGHHTVGKLSGPGSVIDTLMGYDDDGPIFSEPGPVSQFLAARAHLYATVYLSPPNRFRMVVLIDLLKGIAGNPACAELVFERNGGQQLHFFDFIKLDDVSLSERIRQLSNNKTLNEGMQSKAKTALGVFVKGEPKYRPYWLPAPIDRSRVVPTEEQPAELFWDTFSDVGGPLYAEHSVRVKNEQYKYYKYYNSVRDLAKGGLIPLEHCGGPYNLIAKQKSFMLPAAIETGGAQLESAASLDHASLRPMPGCILLFEPETKQSGHWQRFEADRKSGQLFTYLMAHDPLTPYGVRSNTWGDRAFHGPKIFISYAGADRFVVRKLMNSLHKQKRQYCALADDFQDLGKPTKENSKEYVNNAEAIILVVSQEYVRAYRDPDRHVHLEVDQIKQHKDRLILVPVLADPFPALPDGLPWDELGYTSGRPPWMGEKDLREIPTPDVDRAIEAVLEFIDGKRNYK